MRVLGLKPGAENGTWSLVVRHDGMLAIGRLSDVTFVNFTDEPVVAKGRIVKAGCLQSSPLLVEGELLVETKGFIDTMLREHTELTAACLDASPVYQQGAGATGDWALVLRYQPKFVEKLARQTHGRLRPVLFDKSAGAYDRLSSLHRAALYDAVVAILDVTESSEYEEA